MGEMVKSIKHYNSFQKILLVGEGDFSFARCLARAFGSAHNMFATSLDDEGSLSDKYLKANDNLSELKERGCKVFHEVNAHNMNRHPILSTELYDIIVFNFPHAGFIYSEHDPRQIELHQHLVLGFLESAEKMVAAGGEIHITHKLAYPFYLWGIEVLAKAVGLHLKEEATFSVFDYPSYVNKRGSGYRCDATFPVGLCSTFKFVKIYD